MLAATAVALAWAAPGCRYAPLRAPVVRAAVLDGAGDALDGAFWAELESAADEEAAALGLSVESITLASGKLSVLASGAGLDELQALNAHLSAVIDAAADDEEVRDLPPFLLEVSSPGLSATLRSDADYTAFKGFEVTVTTTEPVKGKREWVGSLLGRDDEVVRLNLRGRTVKLPRELVDEVRLPAAKTEAGDPYG